MKRILLAITFGICLCGIANAQPGAAQKAIVDKAIEASKEWKIDKVEIGWDRGPVLKGSFERDKGEISCGSQKSGAEKTDRDIRPEKSVERNAPEKPEKPERAIRERTAPEKDDRGAKERPAPRDKN